MMKIKLLLITMITFFIGFTSCTSDNEDNPAPVKKTTVKEDKENIKASVDKFYNCLESLNDGGFSDFFYKATIGTSKEEVIPGCIDYELGENGYPLEDAQGNLIEKPCKETKLHLITLSEQFDKQFNNLGRDNGFNYTGIKGKYTWNNTTKEWAKEAGDKIEILFPSEPSKTTNNAKLVMDSYEDKEASFGKDKPKLPTKAHAIITIDNVRTFEITVSNVTYDVGTNVTLPTSANIEIFTNPFTSKLTVKRNTETEFEINYNLNSDGGCGYTLNNLVTLKDNDYENINSLEDDFKALKGYFSHNSLKIEYNVDIEGYNKLGKKGEPISETDFNNYVDAKVFYNNIKISDLTYDSSDKKNPVFIIYKDGTKESARNFVPDFEEKIKTIFKKFIDEK